MNVQGYKHNEWTWHVVSPTEYPNLNAGDKISVFDIEGILLIEGRVAVDTWWSPESAVFTIMYPILPTDPSPMFFVWFTMQSGSI